MKAETLKAIIRSFNSASDDHTRYAIVHILLFADNKLVNIVSTDGHILSMQTVDDEEFCALIGSTRYLVAPEQLGFLKQLAKDFKNSDITCEIGEKNVLVLKNVNSMATIVPEKSIGFEYPDYKQVIPKHPEESLSIGLNPELLMSLYKALATDKRMGVKLTIKDKGSPIIVTVGDQTGVLMPMRL